MISVPYGTQLSFWDDYPSEHDIVFSITYCVQGCPFSGVYEARDKGTTIFSQRFGDELKDPAKYLITIKKDFYTSWGDRLYHYIADDQWEALSKITELTGKRPLWKMGYADERLPSNYGGH